MRCAIGLAENMQDLSIGGWNVNVNNEIKAYKYLIVNVFQAKDVFAVDSSNCGLYLKVRCYNSTG